MEDVFVVDAKRSPVGRKGGVLRTVRPDDLLAQVIRGLLAECPDLDQSAIDDVIVGCAIPEAEQGLNVARMASRLAGLPVSVPAMTINRYCASGLQAIHEGALLIATGKAHVVLAGGVESMTVMPRISGHVQRPNPRFFSEPELYPLSWNMGLTAERLASQYGISREHQDLFALASHSKAIEALKGGVFDAEIVPIDVVRRIPGRQGEVTVLSSRVTVDEGPRDDTSLEKLARLDTVFKKSGTVTAGNSAQMSDGAAMTLLMSKEALSRYHLKPKARFVDYVAVGVPPEVMGIGPAVAVPRLLKRLGWSSDSLDWIELNEAFAVQALAVMQDLDWEPRKINPLGGAIALGHPLGASGAMRAATLINAMGRAEIKRGLVTLCVGMGMGVAGAFEKIN